MNPNSGGLPNGETGARINAEPAKVKSAEAKAVEAQMKQAAAEAKARNAQDAKKVADEIAVASTPPAGTPEKGLLTLADNNDGQPLSALTKDPGLSDTSSEMPPTIGSATPPTQEASPHTAQSSESLQTPPTAEAREDVQSGADTPTNLPEPPLSTVDKLPAQPAQPDTQTPDQPASPDMPKPPDVPPASTQPAQVTVDNGVGMAPPLDAAAEQKRLRSNFVKNQLQSGIVQEDLRRALGNDYDSLMKDMVGDSASPKEFDIDAEIKRLGEKQQRTQAENRLLMRLQEMNGLSLGEEGRQELSQLDPQSADYAAKKAEADKKIAAEQHAVRNIDEREQMLQDQKFVEFLKGQGKDVDAIDVEAELEVLNNIPKDKITPEQQHMKDRFEEAQLIAKSNEGQSELLTLRASGEDLTTDTGRKKEDDALKKISQDGDASKAREKFAMRMGVLGDKSLRNLFNEAGGYPVDDVEGTLKHLQQKPDKSPAEERLQRRLQELQGQIRVADGMQQFKNARSDAERFEAVKKIGHGHEQERNWLRKRLDSIGEGLAKLSNENLKDLHRQAFGYRRGLKTLKKQLHDAEKQGIKGKQLKDLQDSVKNAKNLYKAARNEWLKKLGLKGFLLWFFVIGPAALVAVPALLPSKIMQWGGKAGGGH